MKKVFSLLAMAAIVLSVGLSSCAKEDTADSLNVDLNRTATIKGKILINEDETKTEPTWSAPREVVISATVPYTSLNGNAAGGTYVIPSSNISYTASTGEFTITAPVGVSGSVVSVKLSQFTGSVRVADPANAGSSKTINVIWDSQEKDSNSAKPGETVYLDQWELSTDAYYTEVKNAGDKI
ncbi:MAG: hypothetical protein LBQ60_04670 [Bacteroidales bacterium]|jgi:hypothetical protein|nr:hypothetical protein [Bacteroidales bacterium]